MPPTLFWLAVGTFVFGTETALIAGLMPQMSSDLSLPPGRIGALLGIFAVTYAVSSPVLAIVMRTVDRRALLVGGMGAVCAFDCLIALSSRYDLLVGCFMMMALAAAAFLPNALALANGLLASEHRGRALGTLAIGQTVGTAVGVPICSLLGSAYGWRVSFVAVGAIACSCAIGIWVAAPRSEPLQTATIGQRLQVLGLPTVRIALLFIAAWSFSGSLLNTYFGPYMELFGIRGFEFAWALGLIGAGTIASGFFGGWVTDRLGGMSTIAIFIAVVCCLLTCLALVPTEPRWKWLMLCLISLWPVFGYGIIPARQAQLIALAPQWATVLMAFYATAAYSGIAAGSAAGGILIERAGAGALVVGSSALAVLAFMFLLGERIQSQRELSRIHVIAADGEPAARHRLKAG